MTQILEAKEYQVKQGSENNFRIKRQRKKLTLNYIFRYVVITEKKQKIRAIPRILLTEISNKIDIDFKVVRSIVNRFMVDLIGFKRCIKENADMGNTKSRGTLLRYYIRRLYRVAPVFDYERARKNSKILNKKLKPIYLDPHISTQLAVVIYKTDDLDHAKIKDILQSNTRLACNCSAYAFHRTRNRLGLNKKKRIT